MKKNHSRVSIALKDSKEMHIYLTSDEASKLLDQMYSIWSGELSDNCLEITGEYEEGCSQTILVRADHIVYCVSRGVDEQD
jgi:hypothetical protein